jgi:signal transduction histidine kinase
VENGVIVGYTEASGERGAGIPPAAWIGAVAAFIIGSGLWLLLYARWRSVTNRVLSRLYVQVTGIVPDSASMDRSVNVKTEFSHDSIATAVPLEDRLERELAQLEGYVRKLETVRRSMVADIAHELRTPLAIMRSQLENALIAETPLTLEKTAAMHDELLFLTKLVHDLQELALAEAGKLPLEKRWFSLREVSRAVIEALQGDAEEQSLSVELHARGDVRVYADPLRIRQLIVNLIGNALQHARSQVTVTVLQQDGHAIWTVKDDGFGIEEEQIAYLFERFYRNDSEPRESNRRGLGLGLSIVKQYTEAHGGIIDVESRWGEGTIFRIQLPIIAA